MFTIKYKVTKEILQQAQKRRTQTDYWATESCAIALATGGTAGINGVELIIDHKRKIGMYPPEVKAYIAVFDNCLTEKITDLPELEFELIFN